MVTLTRWVAADKTPAVPICSSPASLFVTRVRVTYVPGVADDLPTLTLADAADWDAWLAANPESPGAWLVIAKKSSTMRTPSYAETAKVALCHGWIDGQARRHDDDSYRQRYTPRRRRSPWSQTNRATPERLIAEARMRPAGLAQVEAAKADGRWEQS